MRFVQDFVLLLHLGLVAPLLDQAFPLTHVLLCVWHVNPLHMLLASGCGQSEMPAFCSNAGHQLAGDRNRRVCGGRTGRSGAAAGLKAAGAAAGLKAAGTAGTQRLVERVAAAGKSTPGPG